jgi:geranylgeranyl diphosphate synthase type I
MISLEASLSGYVLSLREELQAVVQGFEHHPAGFRSMLHRHLEGERTALTPRLSWTGRYLQPVLCLLACEACGGDWKQALPAAAAIELLISFALVHEEADGRKGIYCSYPEWTSRDHAHEVNAGDALFALANLSLGRLYERGVPIATVLAILGLFNRAELAFATGQYFDIDLESCADVSIEDYLAMAEGKAALAACACEIGALVASAPDVWCESLRSFGHHLGLAHCICGDVLRGWDRARGIGVAGESWPPGRRECIEQLAREYRLQAIAALERGNLRGPAVQIFRELTLMPFGKVQLSRPMREVECLPSL